MHVTICKAVVMLSLFCAVSCEENFVADDRELLTKSWSHSYEESTSDSIALYRPSNFKKFPGSMFRQVFDFRENDRCQYLVLSPDDGHYMEDGRWQFDETDRTVTLMNMVMDTVFRFRVVELHDDLLKIMEE